MWDGLSQGRLVVGRSLLPWDGELAMHVKW